MTIIYEDIPPFEERISGTTIIVIGRIEEAINKEADHIGDGSKIQVTFRVNVDSVLKGTVSLNSLKVRVLEDKAEASVFPRMKIGNRVILMLSPDYGPNMNQDSFVLYFNSVFPIEGEDQVILDQNTASQLATQNVEIKENTLVKLDVIRSLITSVIKRKEKQDSMLEELVPAELRKVSYPEIPGVIRPANGGPLFSAPEYEPDKTT